MSDYVLLAICVMLVSDVTYTSTLKMEAICSSETLVLSELHGLTMQEVEVILVV
jgi:hypothetical protein